MTLPANHNHQSSTHAAQHSSDMKEHIANSRFGSVFSVEATDVDSITEYRDKDRVLHIHIPRRHFIDRAHYADPWC